MVFDGLREEGWGGQVPPLPSAGLPRKRQRLRCGSIKALVAHLRINQARVLVRLVTRSFDSSATWAARSCALKLSDYGKPSIPNRNSMRWPPRAISPSPRWSSPLGRCSVFSQTTRHSSCQNAPWGLHCGNVTCTQSRTSGCAGMRN
jgi:hypothetical protein